MRCAVAALGAGAALVVLGARGAEALDADEEFIVLEGALEIDGVAYGRHDYAHLPRGLRRSGLRSVGGVA